MISVMSLELSAWSSLFVVWACIFRIGIYKRRREPEGGEEGRKKNPGRQA